MRSVTSDFSVMGGPNWTFRGFAEHCHQQRCSAAAKLYMSMGYQSVTVDILWDIYILHDKAVNVWWS